MPPTVLPIPESTGLSLSKGRVFPHHCRATGGQPFLQWVFDPGTLSSSDWLYTDFYYSSPIQSAFRMELREGTDGPCFYTTFAVLPGVPARLRFPLARTDLNAWALFREGGLLKRCCYGDRVDLARVDRIRIGIDRMAEDPVEWEMTSPALSTTEPAWLHNPDLPDGPLVDSFGQCHQWEWPGKAHSLQDVRDNLSAWQQRAQTGAALPDRSRWGGWSGLSFDPTGFFYLHKSDDRWWLVDPDGHAYWSAAIDCARMGSPASIAGLENTVEGGSDFLNAYPQCRHHNPTAPLHFRSQFDFVHANLQRAMDSDNVGEEWADRMVALLRHLGFNGFGNWSLSEAASRRQFPYVHPLQESFSNLPKVFRDFPDIWHPDWPETTHRFARQLNAFREDPALIGYFLMNEPKWGFASQTPAEGLLRNAPDGHARSAFVEWLRQRYPEPKAFSRAWGDAFSFEAVAAGPVSAPLPESAQPDLEAFSTVMAAKFFRDLSAACRKVDPNHLNLGVRYYTIPPQWLVQAMDGFDAFSMNCYDHRIPAEALGPVVDQLHMPVLIGEWHFGALDVGLPMAGICRVANQRERGRAYRAYLEHAAAQPWCIGAHYFQLYDQPFLGRFDGENWNIGLLDIAHRLYEPFAEAVRESHKALYPVAAGRIPPFSGTPDYRPRHFC